MNFLVHLPGHLEKKHAGACFLHISSCEKKHNRMFFRCLRYLKVISFFVRAKTRCIMLYYHFARKFIFKVSFDSQLNYVLHRDKASEHNNHGIRRKLCELKQYLHLVIIWIISLFSVLYLSFIRLIVVLLFWANRVASEQLPRCSKLCPQPQIECAHCLFAFLLHNKRQWVKNHANC